MGGGLALQAMEKGMRVVGLQRGNAPAEMLEAGLVEVGDAAGSSSSFRVHGSSSCTFPRPDGGRVVDTLAGVLQAGDIVVDGGNSYWGD